VSGRLVCRLRAGVTLSFELRESEAVLGREPGIAVALPADGVSRRHARVTWDGKSHWVEDLRSTNGTFVNGHPVSREKLRHLDVVTLGKGVELVFLTSEAAAPPPPRLAIVRAVLVELGGDATAHEIAVGEVTLGRSPSCNVVSDFGDVSKVHARVERTRDQLLLEDLGSANGSFVNDVRVESVFLKAGDVVRLGGSEAFRVELETGTITGGSGRHSETLAREARAEQRFSADWKTRFLLTGEERERVVAFRRRLREKDAERAASAFEKTKRSPAAGRPAAAAPAKPAPAAPTKPAAPAPAPAPAPKAPAAAAPSKAAAAAPAPGPKAPAPPPQAKAAPQAAPPASPPAAPKAPVPATPSGDKKAIPPKAPPTDMLTPARPMPARPTPSQPTPPTPAMLPIREIRFSSETLSLVVSGPGEHVLGRSPEAALRVDHPTVSRRHATVVVSDDRTAAYLRHEGGLNGTRLNARLVEKLTPLADGDVLSMGDVELRVTVVRG
jgi:pSer/pThr/pTyr-binding forkhead associated (FHA) protein